ncbi:GyrI-like domain-containing protein [Demequina muriae]|uniref:GyrI-like domain-containing protein n=1 Tax=Demequina muriae TaxID=3051664 RepID=A0ABT8GH75_9MICO|nr:GyrI-like domain-containing protein [Demequina sp. EGI L300058]MDN4480301.1 GyrI-like domain-containing protein [Demequina sp. EGI L300058]
MAEFRVEWRKAVDYIALPVHTTMAELPARVGPAIDELEAYLDQRGAEPIGAGLFRYRSVSAEAPFTVEVGQAVANVPRVRDRYVVGRLDEGRYAVATQRGPYAWIGGLTQELMEWGDVQGLDFAVTPGEGTRPDEWACWYEDYANDTVEGPVGLEGTVDVCLRLRE